MSRATPAANTASNEAAVAPRARRGGDATATRILDAAEDLFAERGYAGATLRDVATRVGVRNPSIYNHFAGKEALYEAVLGRVVSPVFDALSDLVEAGPAADRHAVIAKTMEILGEHPNVARLLLHETLAGGEHLTVILRDSIGPIFARAHEAVRAGPAPDRWEEDQLPLLVLAMYHIVIGYFAIAPLYRELADTDLLTEEMRERQTRLVGEISDLLFATPAASPPKGESR